MTIVHLAELQRTHRAREGTSRRLKLRAYLLERAEPTAAIFIIVSRHLYARTMIDNLGLADQWLSGASEAERAGLLSEINTAMLT